MIPQIHEQLMKYGLHDLTRLEYGRLMWKKPNNRERLLRHWNDERHPYRDRFQETYRPLVERILNAPEEEDDQLNDALMAEGLSLRAVIREIPPVFGLFYGDSAKPSA